MNRIAVAVIAAGALVATGCGGGSGHPAAHASSTPTVRASAPADAKLAAAVNLQRADFDSRWQIAPGPKSASRLLQVLQCAGGSSGIRGLVADVGSPVFGVHGSAAVSAVEAVSSVTVEDSAAAAKKVFPDLTSQYAKKCLQDALTSNAATAVGKAAQHVRVAVERDTALSPVGDESVAYHAQVHATVSGRDVVTGESVQIFWRQGRLLVGLNVVAVGGEQITSALLSTLVNKMSARAATRK